MAASLNLNRSYRVFISFRGKDVRKNFLSHLYTALNEKGIPTFVDSEELRPGDQISATLVRAIEESRVAIIILSKDYASSPWCLEEAVKIMECHEQKGLIVFPVFYKVEPREVRRGRKSYGRAMANHESKFGKDSEKVRRWKKALFDAGSLSGCNSNDSDEAELIRRIVEEVSIHLDRTLLDVAKYPVGIDSRVQELISLLEKEAAANDVLMIGLWGPGGIGKTSTAKALYNALYKAIERQFQRFSFLALVRETSNQTNGLVTLQKQLLEILFNKTISVYSVEQGSSLIRERLYCKKVLLVLDDVDRRNQLNALAGKRDWFGKGSIIIVTSRDKHLLTSHGINCVYEVQSLQYEEALDLFRWHAFDDGKRVEIRRDIIDRALRYANSLPLALEVLGSFLFGRDESAWISALDKLFKSPDRTINQILKVSFDGLEDNEKEIFLYIACFFRGKSKEYIGRVLDKCDLKTTIGVEILTERSLVKSEHGVLQMHDLIQLMGKDIVNQECCDDLGKRSRIWLLEDFVNILDENTEKNAVKAIVLNRCALEKRIRPDAFANMKKLKILILREVHIPSTGPICLPKELRWLEWDHDFGSDSKKPMNLDVWDNPIKQFGCEFQNQRKLRSITFRNCEFLASIPDLSSVPNLEELQLDFCTSLVEVHQSVGYLKKLKTLSLLGCSNLSEFPSTLEAKSLVYLNLAGCTKLEKFPDISVKMEHLTYLNLGGIAIKELPASIKNIVFLRIINLHDCKNLAMLPSSICKLKHLSILDLQGCPNFVMVPEDSMDSTDPDGDLRYQNLETLGLDGCNLSAVEFLESSSRFPKLESLYLSGDKLNPPKWLQLDGRNLSAVEFLESSSRFPKLKQLVLSGDKSNYLSTWIGSYDYWKGLFALERKRSQEIPRLPSNMVITEANSCNFLHALPDSSSLPYDCLELDSDDGDYDSGDYDSDDGDFSPLEKVPKRKRFQVLIRGREMPEWILHCKEEDGFTSFMVPRDLYDKFLGLAICAVLGGPKEGREFVGRWGFELSVNGERVWRNIGWPLLLESDQVWLYYLSRSSLDGVEELMRNDWSHFQVKFNRRDTSMKKCGFRLICEKREDDLKVWTPTPSAEANETGNLKERDLGKRQFSVDSEEEDSPMKRGLTKKIRRS